jgi:hypothetical protein
MLTQRLAVTLALTTLIALPVTACRSSDADEEGASSTATSALQIQSQAGLTDAVVDVEGDVAPTAEDAAKAEAERPLSRLQPEGCATKTRQGNVVTLDLVGCTGPFGKSKIDGRLVATFTRPTPELTVVAIEAGPGTTANGKALTYSASAEIRFDGAQRFITYHGSSSGTTRRGREFARSTDASIVVDVATRCVTMNGASKGTIGSFGVDLTVEGFHGCRNACPTAGVVRATVDGPSSKDATIEMTFDGSATAHVKVDARRKREIDVALECDDGEASE